MSKSTRKILFVALTLILLIATGAVIFLTREPAQQQKPQAAAASAPAGTTFAESSPLGANSLPSSAELLENFQQQALALPSPEQSPAEMGREMGYYARVALAMAEVYPDGPPSRDSAAYSRYERLARKLREGATIQKSPQRLHEAPPGHWAQYKLAFLEQLLPLDPATHQEMEATFSRAYDQMMDGALMEYQEPYGNAEARQQWKSRRQDLSRETHAALQELLTGETRSQFQHICDPHFLLTDWMAQPMPKLHPPRAERTES